MRNTRRFLWVGAALAIGLSACSTNTDPPTSTPPTNAQEAEPTPATYGYEILESIPMDTSFFTQGLEYLDDGTVLISGGRYGNSSIAVIDGETGEVLRSQELSEVYFGEGATVVDETIHQITWRENTVHTWDVSTLEAGPTFSYDGEGWGLCYDEGRDVLWRSDGSSSLFEHDPETWELLGEIPVHLDGSAQDGINELECVEGEIWANVFTTNEILHLDPATGAVLGVLELDDLEADAREINGRRFDRNQVLNGIAYDASRDAYLVTGKEWPVAYLITIGQ